MKIAIHHREGSFSERWIDYCEEKQLDFLIVSCYQSNIIERLSEEKITHLMWHLNNDFYKDLMVFPYVLNAADKMGIHTFPNHMARWHFDDKIAQKYLLESIEAPLADSYVFYEKESAINFLEKIKLPVVAKLKRGASSNNVKLIHTKEQGKIYIEKLFNEGIESIDYPFENLDQKIRIAKKYKNPLKLLKKVYGYFKKNKKERRLAKREKGYVYFQKFLPNNDYDTRIIVIDDKAFGIRRLNRDEDFRASGSGKIDYSVDKIDTKMINIAFSVTEKIGAQCLAFDFVYNSKNEIRILEICFCFSMEAYDKCEGYWHRDMSFVSDQFNPQEFMIESFIYG